jgi:hypothetical protein
MDPISIALGVGSLVSAAIPAIKSLLDEGLDPNSAEFKQRAAALGVKGPAFDTALKAAQEETFGAIGASKEVGQQQADLASALKAQMEGKGQSLAAMQYARALEASQAAAASQIASARGLSPAQAQRLLMTQQAAARQAAAGKSAELRLQEQQVAQSALGNLLGQQRQQELLGGQLAAGMYGTASQIGMEQARLDQQAKMAALNLDQQNQATQRQMAGTIATAGATFAQPFLSDGLKTAPAQPATATPPAPSKNSKGGEIKGRANYRGDTTSNDTVPALLSPGEIVLPRTVAQDDKAPEKAKKFVEAIKKNKRPSPQAFSEALARLAELESRLNAMEALADLEAEEDG